jgi:NAD(P)H-dependent flavin oxidoreductase YrpB (nitropropane dioxygenase family)
MTDRPFGVNLTFLPSFAALPYPEYIRAIVEGGIRIAIEGEKGAATAIGDIRHLVAGSENRRMLQEGVMDAAAWSCGMVAGLIHDIPTCKELIDRIVQGAEKIISRRLDALLAA